MDGGEIAGANKGGGFESWLTTPGGSDERWPGREGGHSIHYLAKLGVRTGGKGSVRTARGVSATQLMGLLLLNHCTIYSVDASTGRSILAPLGVAQPTPDKYCNLLQYGLMIPSIITTFIPLLTSIKQSVLKTLG
jgi:hypothetical protein